jgi:RHS repeat-associated protein
LYRRRLNNRRKNISPGESGKFSSKELDLETGLYYYDVRYLDPKTSRWLSGDPALGDYLPGAPVDEEAWKRNGNLPGQGGAFSLVNMHVYHYAGNNPVKYVDPNGKFAISWPLVFSIIKEFVLPAIGAYLTVRAINETAEYAASIESKSLPTEENQSANDSVSEYIPPPRDLSGIPGAKWARPKTPVQGGGGLRRRWKDEEGNIYEWDYQEGHVEKYNPRGKHQGAFDPNTGEQKKPADPKREVEP